jgi:MtN3 and saliva related transmembrane protein
MPEAEETLAEAIGWGSSIILLMTLTRQVYKQWHEKTTEGVSMWLFAGQVAASAGFTTYSVLLGNTVFIVTNSLILLNALVGFGITRWQRAHGQ